MAIEVFISYSHNDQALRTELDKHLSILKRQNVITSWYDGNLIPGAEWEPEIMKRLNRAQIILLLVSADFIASDFCYSIEMKEAIARHDANQARVIPILLRPTDWKGASFSKLKMLPTDAKAATSWPSLDDAFVDVVQGIRAAIDELNITRKTANWSIASGLKPHKWTLRGHKRPIKSVAISSGGQTLASGISDGTINVWDLQAEQLLHTLTGHIGPVSSVAISPDGQFFASGGADMTIKVWEK